MSTRMIRRALLGGAFSLLAPLAAHAQARDLTVALQSMGPASSLETVQNNGTAGRKVLNSIFEQLIALDLQDPNLAMKPGLATEWTWVDEKTLEMKLREGVRFHNGDLMTPADVIFSFSDERYGNLPEQVAAREAGQTSFTRPDGTIGIVPPASVAASQKSSWPLLERIEEVDAQTVRFVMTKATLDTEARLSRVNHAAIISKRAFREAKSWNDWAAAPISTGPYKVTRLDPGSAIFLQGFDAYWQGKPPVDELKFMIVPEAASRLNGLMSGEYDIISDMAPDQVPLITADEDFKVVGGAVANVRHLAFDKYKGPMQNVKVRQALTHAIDRETIVNVLWSGLTSQSPGYQHPIFGDLFADTHQTPAYDPERAKALLAEAGYKGEVIKMRAHNDYYPNELNVAQFNLENLRKIGFNIEFSIVEESTDPLPDRMIGELSNTAYFSFPIALLANHCPNGSYNAKTNPNGMWQNDEFDRLCGVLETSTDKAEVKAAFTRALEIIERDDPGLVVTHQNAILYGTRAEIEWKPSAMFVMDFRPGKIAFAK